VRPVENPGSRIDARPQAVQALPGQVRAQVDRDVPVEPGFV
jgi:hypothetical protein